MFDTREGFERAYSSTYIAPNGKAVRLGYHRVALYPLAELHAAKLVEKLGIKSSDRVLIIGCGFGWLVEALQPHCKRVIGTETSDYILTHHRESEEPDLRRAMYDAKVWDKETLMHLLAGGVRTRAIIVGEDSMTPASRNSVVSILGGRPNYVITEDVLPSLSCKCDVPAIAHALDGYQSEVYHLLTPKMEGMEGRQDPNMLWLQPIKWKELTNQNIITVGDYQVY